MEVFYNEILEKYAQINSFFQDKNILKATPIASIWRSKNLILKVDCDDGQSYLFKRIAEDSEVSEIPLAVKLKQEYPQLFPAIYSTEGNAYLMEFIEGRTFFALQKDEKADYLDKCGQLLQQIWYSSASDEKDISDLMKRSFEQRRKKAGKFFSQDELTSYDFSCFTAVPQRMSHNDLNVANLFFVSNETVGIKMIDPQEMGFNDIARDIGRYCASAFFNNYDRFGNDAKHSVEIADAFISHFREQDVERAKYYIGESFLSFLNYDTVSVPKDVLKKLTLNVLTKKGSIV